MSEVRLYEALADAFHKEGVDTVFSLTGDGNMYWDTAYNRLPGAKSYHVRHEHCACAMATAYAATTGKVGVASITCGPGVTQISTALATAVAARIPLVVFAGESPLHTSWYNQFIDQAPVIDATGAKYIAAHSAKQIMFHVAQAFVIARTERRPVVLGVPMDVQQEISKFPYRPSSHFIPDNGPRAAHPDYVERAAQRIREARRVMIIGGRGARDAQAREACEALADMVDGALSATLPARGLFSGHPRYVGVAGGFIHEAARELFEKSDLIIAVGTSLTQHTSDLNLLFKPENVIQIDDNPQPIKHGQRPANLVLCADAKLGVEALINALEISGHRSSEADWAPRETARRVLEEPADSTPYDVGNDVLDPRAVAATMDKALPRDWNYVSSSGHSSYFGTHLHNRLAENYLVLREFGVIGNGLSYAIGMAIAKPEKPVVLIEGDGSLMMHIQELETAKRYGIKMLLCIFNDGAYGAEIHKLRADNLSDSSAVYGRHDLARLAEGFALRGRTVSKLDQIPELLEEFDNGHDTMLWDIQISDQVMAPTMRRSTRRK